jgi:TPR repeat protein
VAQDNAEAQTNLGFMYSTGRGVAQNFTEAVKWYRLAAEQGHAQGQNNLGSKYDKGEGVAQDYARSYMWFSLSAQTGHEEAARNLDIVKAKMTPLQIVTAVKMAEECRKRDFANC